MTTGVMEYYGDIMAVTVNDLTRSDDGEAVLTYENYHKLQVRGRIEVLRPGKGLGSYALISYASLPKRFRDRFEMKYGDPALLVKRTDVRTDITWDVKAQAYFSGYRLPSGKGIPEEKQRECTLNASVLNTLVAMAETQKAKRNSLNSRTPVSWDGIIAASDALRDRYSHTLPRGEARLKDKMRQFAKEGYSCLVSGKLGNTNVTKITAAAGRQIVALARSRCPRYTTRQIFEEYNRIAGRKGWKPIESQSSVLQYLNRPDIRPKWIDAEIGELNAKQRYTRMNKTERPSMRDSLWYGDGTKLNLYYRDTQGGKTVMRTCMVYEVSDAFNDTLLGYSICRTENFAAQRAAFRMALRESGHKPYEIVTDNQGGQTSDAAKSLFGKICRVARTTQPYNPQSKTIERLFGQFQAQVLHGLYNYTGGNISSKKAWQVDREFLAANVDRLPTYEELCGIYAEARRKWNSMPNPVRKGQDLPAGVTEGMSRMEAYRASVNTAVEPFTDVDDVSIFWEQGDKPVKFTTGGLTISRNGRRYTYEVMGPDGLPDMDWFSSNVGREFIVRNDPDDMGLVKLYVPSSNGLCFIADARPYITVHRNIQEQTEGDAALIRHFEAENKRLRVRRSIEGKELELEHGVAPEQHGLVSPPVRISERDYEDIADSLPSPDVTDIDPVEYGRYTKDLSNADYNPLDIYNRM